MTRREYVLNVWLRENRVWLAVACAVIGILTAPAVPGAGAQALAWLGAAVAWCAFLTLLRAVTWTPWTDVGRGYEPPRMPEMPPEDEPLPSNVTRPGAWWGGHP
ncbi:hypothetical protein [Methylorubrum extorquens]|uniref:hypothetical protein n=1 Tax=Methylorubrum extorquens TaxID=408 RepID=UPI0022370E3E|nr:hypothetical protein [Methylorubrum extorquens]UYW30365.1 hypothetical protein OKB92_15270 [Methylorubrum extorquens]